MYQQQEKLAFIEVASGLAQWATARFGYFVKANKTDEEKIEVVQALSEELARLPQGCMKHVEAMKARWMEEGHSRSPSVSHILQSLRELNNREMNSAPKIEYDKSAAYGATAKTWDGLKTDEERHGFVKNIRSKPISAATKWVVRRWMRTADYNEKQITAKLGYGW